MRYIDVTLAKNLEKRRVYIGESAFMLEPSDQLVEYWEEEVELYESGYKEPRNKELPSIAKAQVVGKTIIRIFPFPIESKELEEIRDYHWLGGKSNMTAYGAPLEPLFVTESVEEIYKLIEEADVREYKKMYSVFKHLKLLDEKD